MSPIVLMAELLAYGIDVELRDTTLHFVGNISLLPVEMRDELNMRHHDLAELALAAQAGALHAD
jgi:hypothetical protein